MFTSPSGKCNTEQRPQQTENKPKELGILFMCMCEVCVGVCVCSKAMSASLWDLTEQSCACCIIPIHQKVPELVLIPCCIVLFVIWKWNRQFICLSYYQWWYISNITVYCLKYIIQCCGCTVYCSQLSFLDAAFMWTCLFWSAIVICPFFLSVYLPPLNRPGV